MEEVDPAEVAKKMLQIQRKVSVVLKQIALAEIQGAGKKNAVKQKSKDQMEKDRLNERIKSLLCHT